MDDLQRFSTVKLEDTLKVLHDLSKSNDLDCIYREEIESVYDIIDNIIHDRHSDIQRVASELDDPKHRGVVTLHCERVFANEVKRNIQHELDCRNNDTFISMHYNAADHIASFEYVS